ncbi:MAG: trehalose-phosphatase [Gammaproteobacteria bacterium]
MQSIFSARNRQVLQRFASAGTLVALDFDGTLAPIVRDRDRAAMRQTTRRLLARLAVQYPCVVISGRARSDVRRRLKEAGIRHIVGNHGIEPWSTSPELESAVRRWFPLIEESLRQFPGAGVEDKRFSVAVHYRGEPRKQQVRRAIATVAARLGEVRLVGGKQVVNILPAQAPHKGVAFAQALRRSRCKRAIYIGDDDTDEDVFVLPGGGRLLTIRIGLNRDSLARYYIRSQRDIDRFIRKLIELRAGPTAGK